MENLILASSSPRRQELLGQLGLDFKVYAPDIDESQHLGETITDYVARLAHEKARQTLHKFPDAVIVAADTSLALDGQIIGKPNSKQHAFEIWHALSGRSHDVFSGICIATATDFLTEVVQSTVWFEHLSDQDMEQYWRSEEPIGKAGAYAIQGRAAQFIRRIEGSYSNIVGLPLYETAQLLKSVGFNV